MVTLGAAAPVFLVGMVAAGAFMGAGVGFAAMGAATHDWNQAVRSAQVGAIGGAIGGLASGGVMLGVAAFSTAGLGGGVVAGNAAHAVMRAGLGGQVLMGVTGGVSGGFAGGFSGSVVGDWAAGQGVNWGNAFMAGLTGGALGGALGAALPLAWAGLRQAGRGAVWTAHRIRSANTNGGRQLFWHGSAEGVAQREASGLFVARPGNGGLYWTTSVERIEDLGVGTWKIGGNTNVKLFPPKLINKGGIQATYRLAAGEASVFRRAWGFDFNWNPYQWWKGAVGQYYFRPGPVTWAQRSGEVGQALGITGTALGGAWVINELENR